MKSTVQSLFASRGPSRIFRGVANVIIDSVDGMIGGRTLPDVLHKLAEIVFPFFAHPDAARTVNSVFGCPLIVAAIFHRPPRSIEWMLSYVPEFIDFRIESSRLSAVIPPRLTLKASAR